MAFQNPQDPGHSLKQTLEPLNFWSIFLFFGLSLTLGFPSVLRLDVIMIETAMDILVPSWWEIQVTVASSLFVIVAYWFFTYRSGDVDVQRLDRNSTNPGVTVSFYFFWEFWCGFLWGFPLAMRIKVNFFLVCFGLFFLPIFGVNLCGCLRSDCFECENLVGSYEL